MKKCLLLLLAFFLWNTQITGYQPDEIESYYRQALTLAKNGQFFEAQDFFRQALKKDPFHIPSRRGLDLLTDLNNGIVSP
ncbi:MAG: tetratricopeptide repeat protein, partial [Candidatus Aminicenantes bacterium]|nr:tetratricopeptide repeat protein [Candidatus Aminicenantes bacterium]